MKLSGKFNQLNEWEGPMVNINTYNPTYKYKTYEEISPPVSRQSFEDWMKEVDEQVIDLYGMSIHDLADRNYRDAYNCGLTAEEYFQEEFYAESEEEMFEMLFMD